MACNMTTNDSIFKTMAIKKKATKKTVKKKATKKASGKGNPRPVQSKPFKKGVSGNAKGRPKGTPTMTGILKGLLMSNELNVEVCSKMPDQDGNMAEESRKFNVTTDKNFSVAISVALIARAVKGDIEAIKVIFDRVEGKAVQMNVDLNNSDFTKLTPEERIEKIQSLIQPKN